MDTFTDVDLFADLLDAASRLVPVYILLDEQEAHHFVSMVFNCKVNLDHHPVSLPFCELSSKAIYCIIYLFITCIPLAYGHNMIEILFYRWCVSGLWQE